MKSIKLKKLPLLGYVNPPYDQRRMTDEEMKRTDIDSDRLYLVQYEDTWLIGRFSMCWYGWSFHPNLGVMSMQVNDLSAIYEIQNLGQKAHGSTATFIAGYLSRETE